MSHVSVLDKTTPRYWHFPSADVISSADGGVVVYDWVDRTQVSFENAEIVDTLAKSLALCDWSDGSVLAKSTHYVLSSVHFPTLSDWDALLAKIPERSGTSAVLLRDSCETYDSVDKSASAMDPIPYRGYAYYVPDKFHWTELDNTSLHKDVLEGDGKNGLPGGWRLYVGRDELAAMSDAYVEAILSSPYYYYILDTGSCQKPTQERVYRLFVDPNDTTKVALEYWGNLASTNETVYRRILLKDYYGSGRSAIVTVQNGGVVAVSEPTEVFDFAKYEIRNSPFPTFSQAEGMVESAVSGKLDVSAFDAAISGYYTSGQVNYEIERATSGKLDSDVLGEYYTSAQTDVAIDSATSGKADASALDAYYTSAETNTAISTAITSAIGDIDTALDTINGEVI